MWGGNGQWQPTSSKIWFPCLINIHRIFAQRVYPKKEIEVVSARSWLRVI